MGALKWELKVPGCPQWYMIAYNCRHFLRKFPFQKRPKGHKCAQLQTIVFEVAESDLKPPLESPHSDFPHGNFSA